MSYTTLFEGLGLLSAVTFLISLLLIPFLISKASSDYFLIHATIVEQRHKRHPAIALLIKIIRNSLGSFLCLAGFMMLFLPGQGVLTILIGASLLDVPGRQKVINALIHRPALQHALNWIRQKTGHPPFNFPSN
ncbi:MAG: PGPGW domain-containing protein [Desulfocapsaceae bacterium]|nr:PGPGW domain-containing protein [Desulfocapsaceae bacterium]